MLMHLRCAGGPGPVGSDQQPPAADPAKQARITIRAPKVEHKWRRRPRCALRHRRRSPSALAAEGRASRDRASRLLRGTEDTEGRLCVGPRDLIKPQPARVVVWQSVDQSADASSVRPGQVLGLGERVLNACQ